MRNTGYSHSEAFMLMLYVQEQRGRGADPLVERIWNSRDGVTPFVVLPHERDLARFGDARMNHVDWHRDVYAPYHPHGGLKVGDRVFVDLTPERAREDLGKQLSIQEEREGDISEWWDDLPGGRDEFIQIRIDELIERGEPDLIVVDAAVLEQLQRRFPRPPMRPTVPGMGGRFA